MGIPNINEGFAFKPNFIVGPPVVVSTRGG